MHSLFSLHYHVFLNTWNHLFSLDHFLSGSKSSKADMTLTAGAGVTAAVAQASAPNPERFDFWVGGWGERYTVIYHGFFPFSYLKLSFMIPKGPSLSKPRRPTSRSMDEETRWSIISFNCGPAQLSTEHGFVLLRAIYFRAQAVAINAIAKTENNINIGPQYVLPYTALFK